MFILPSPPAHGSPWVPVTLPSSLSFRLKSGINASVVIPWGASSSPMGSLNPVYSSVIVSSLHFL